MATQEELRKLMNEAHAAGDMEAVEQLSEMVDNYRLEGYTPQVMQDVQSIAMDAMTRGFGPNDNADVARARQPGWIETPASIAGSVVGTPLKVAGAVGASVLGGADSMLDEYGHQENWIPGTDELYDIGKAGVMGSGLGWLGAKIGDVFGANTSRGKDQPYPTDDLLREAADEADRLAPNSPRTDDLKARSDRLTLARDAQGTGRDEFAKIKAGMTPKEAAAADAISGAPKKTVTKVAETVDKYGKKVPPLQTIVMEALLSGGIPYKTAAAYAAKMALSKAGQKADMPDAKQAEFLASLIRDPRGIGNVGTDPAASDFWRDRFAKVAIGTGKEF